jgi:hypothetical protein
VTHKAAGFLILPPISVPTPIVLPLIATKAPSPPELPPEVQFRLYAFRVIP